jgi:hypothetical protein
LFTVKLVLKLMTRVSPKLLIAAMFCLDGSAHARDVGCTSCDASQAPETAVELRIEISTQLNFSRATVSKRGGNIRVDPQNGTRALDGGVVDLGGMALAGSAIVRGEPGRSVRIELPSNVRMSNNRGGTLTIRNLRTNLSPAPRLDSGGQLSFAFGGDLEISGDAYGDYRGRIPITAEYE